MKTPKKGFKGITVSDALYSQIQDTARIEGLSMPDLLRKMLGDQYPDPGVWEELVNMEEEKRK